MLFRTVKDATALVDELRRRGIPYLIKGFARLFDAPETATVCGLFCYMVDEILGAALRERWVNANPLPDPERFPQVIALLDHARALSTIHPVAAPPVTHRCQTRITPAQ